MQKGIIGIVGGMGPEAGIALSGKIINHTIAGKDQEHLPQILYSLPEMIPDRTEYITGKIRTNPAGAILQILDGMEHAGVTVAGLACNSAHAPQIFDVVESGLRQRSSKIRLLHMVDEAGRFITGNYPGVTRVGILGTTGTYRTRLYDRLHGMGLQTVYTGQQEQQSLHQAIYHPVYGIKSNSVTIPERAMEIIEGAASSLKKAGAEILVIGCTEISLAIKEREYGGLPVADSSVILARALISAHSPEKLRPWMQ